MKFDKQLREWKVTRRCNEWGMQRRSVRSKRWYGIFTLSFQMFVKTPCSSYCVSRESITWLAQNGEIELPEHGLIAYFRNNPRPLISVQSSPEYFFETIAGNPTSASGLAHINSVIPVNARKGSVRVISEWIQSTRLLRTLSKRTWGIWRRKPLKDSTVLV